MDVTHTNLHVPIECSFCNETAMTTAHKCSTFRRACSSNQKGQTNTVHNTGGLNERQAAKAREAKLDMPLGPNMNTAARQSQFPPHEQGQNLVSLRDTSPTNSSKWINCAVCNICKVAQILLSLNGSILKMSNSHSSMSCGQWWQLSMCNAAWTGKQNRHG